MSNPFAEAVSSLTSIQVIAAAEIIAQAHKSRIVIENIAPDRVPSEYEMHKDENLRPEYADKIFPNGSVVHLTLLPF